MGKTKRKLNKYKERWKPKTYSYKEVFQSDKEPLGCRKYPKTGKLILAGRDVPNSSRFLCHRDNSDCVAHKSASAPREPMVPSEVLGDRAKHRQWREYWAKIDNWWNSEMRDEQRGRFR